MNKIWSRLGGQLGVGVCLVGFVAIFFGWNGSAGKDRVPSQFPFLISGAIAGLALVVVGAALLIVQNHRADRALLQGSLRDVRRALESFALAALSRNGSAGGDYVVVGPGAYHRSTCRLIENREALPTLRREEADAQGMAPCRVCEPARVGPPDGTGAGAAAGQKGATPESFAPAVSAPAPRRRPDGTIDLT